MDPESFFMRIVDLLLEKRTPTEMHIGEHRFDVVNFRWNENGFSISFDKGSAISGVAMQFLRSGREACDMKFAALNIEFDCSVKLISVNDSNVG
jgi:hypothetical protein